MPFGFGTGSWGLTPFGSPSPVVTPPAEEAPEQRQPVSGHAHGQVLLTGDTNAEAILGLTEFERGFFHGDPTTAVSTTHVRAYIQTYALPQREHTFGTQSVVSGMVLKAKSWAPAPDADLIPVISDSADIPATITALFSDVGDLEAHIRAIVTDIGDIGAVIQSFTTSDIYAILQSVTPQDINASLESVPPDDIGGNILSVPSVDLGAFAGGHPPADITASLSITQPVDFGAFIRRSFIGDEDISASLNQVGAFVGFPALIKVSERGSGDISAKIRITVTEETDNITAFIQSFTTVDIPASLVTQRIADMRGIITGFSRENTSDINASIRRIDLATADLNSNIAGKELFAGTLDIGATLRTVTPDSSDITANILGVTPTVNINKVKLNVGPFKNIGASITQTGGYQDLPVLFKSVHRTSTTTSENAGFVRVFTTRRFIIGTTKGLFIPNLSDVETFTDIYINDSQTPDLHATLVGWNAGDLGATIRSHPMDSISASVSALSIDRLSNLTAFLTPAHLSDISASLNPSGGFDSLAGSLTTRGAVSDMAASVLGFVGPLSLTVVPVSTKPFNDINATINYDSFVRCAFSSAYSNLGAFLRPLVGNTEDTLRDLAANLNVLRIESNIGATLTAKKYTRLRILDLTFRSKTRDSTALRSSITPVMQSESDLRAIIGGLSHEVDLPATIDVVQFNRPRVLFTASELVTNLQDDLTKEVLISFRSSVSRYVYEAVTSAVYATDQGGWAVDLRSAEQQDSFFDLQPDNRQFTLENVSEYFSLDEAIRGALVILCERRQASIGASITPRFSAEDIKAFISTLPADRIAEISGSLVPVANPPTIYASINTGPGSSSFGAIKSTISPIFAEETENISAIIEGIRVVEFGAEISAI